MTATRETQGITRIVITVAGDLILAGVKFAASIIGPLLLAVFFAILFGMFMRWLEKKGVPHWLAVTITIVSVICRDRRVLPPDRGLFRPAGRRRSPSIRRVSRRP